MATSNAKADFEARYLAALEAGKKRSEVEMRAVSVRFDKVCSSYRVQLHDGRGFTVPLGYIHELNEATPRAMADVTLFGQGEGLYWDALDFTAG
jgi:hypothetical protein